MHRSFPRLAALLACGALVACDGAEPFTPEPGTRNGDPTILAALNCTATVSTGALSCEGATPRTGPASGLIVGGQGMYVQLAGSGQDFDAGTGIFSMDVTVRNLIPQALGTVDGVTPHADGVRVFFEYLPSSPDGSVSIENADGFDFFLSAGQPYFEYDGLLHPDETSGSKPWEFGLMPGVETFSFGVYISAQVRFPEGWVELGTPSAFLLEGTGEALEPVVRNVVGRVLDRTVEWESSNSGIVSVDENGVVTAVSPGIATITATAGPITGTATYSVCPDLAVGEVYTAEMPHAASLCFAGGASGNAEYTYMPVNLSLASSLSLTLTGTGIVGVTGPPSPDMAPSGLLFDRVQDAQVQRNDQLHHEMLRRDQRDVAHLMRRPEARVDRRADASGANRLIVPGVPAVGDLWSLNVASGCAGARDDRVGRVRSIGQHIIIVADTLNPAGGFTTAQYDSIVAEFDTIAYPAAVDAFGAPTDLDSNNRVVAFYTRAVNELSPPASSAVVMGYVTARDLFSAAPESCPRSNEGEMFYMLVPDPTGAVNSNVRTVSFVRGSTVGTLGHEFQHLINASRRIYINEAPELETVWLNEGLSHITEELMFYRTSVGLAPGMNIQLSSLTTGPNASRRVAAFNTYANANYSRFRSFLQRPDTTGPVKNNDGLAVRGATWGFLRYAADRTGGSEADFWYDLVNTTTSGMANLANVLGGDPNLWLRDFLAAMYIDDAVSGASPTYQVPSWNFRSVYGGLGGFPLGTRPLTNNVGLTLSYSAGASTAYARFGVPTSGFATVTALSAGVPPTSPFALIVVRTK